jgi:hypothetical protein
VDRSRLSDDGVGERWARQVPRPIADDARGISMISTAQFEVIKRKHGAYASWAVWADATAKPKSNIVDISHCESDGVLALLRNDVVMVGLNISRPLAEPFRNFHDPHSSANDFKIRYAFNDSIYYGAYMTDIIKLHEDVKSKNVLQYLRERPAVVEQNVSLFLDEIKDLQARAPLILAFGRATYRLLNEHLKKEAYRKLIGITHYSHQIGKERYKDTVLREIASSL